MRPWPQFDGLDRAVGERRRTSGQTFEVEAACGPVLGRWRAGVLEFLGIPYAEAPVGPLRFAAPVRKRRFETVFAALEYGDAAPQQSPLPQSLGRLFGMATSQSEKCLNLNVWTPGTEGKRPVLVFVHGGAFVIGSGAQYPGGDLARRGDCVIVTINYRLGLAGFNGFPELFPGDERFAANPGLLDQRCALRWVQDNIEAFGGDPGQVTLAGESAGAASVAFHLVAEDSKPLFHQAILQSGGLNLFYPRDHAGSLAARVAKALGASGDPDRLFDVSALRLASSLDDVEGEKLGVVARPYVDGVDIPDRPLGEILTLIKPCPTMIGTNRDELAFFIDLPLFPFEWSKPAMEAYVTWVSDADQARTISDLYQDDHDGLIGFGTDLLFRMPAIHAADFQASQASTFMYRLDWKAKGLLARQGATHSVDLPLLFEDFLKPFRSVYLGVMPDHRRQALALRMRDHWLSFVREGRPGVDWPAYETGRRETMIFDLEDRVMHDPERVHRIVWKGIDGWTY
ncbi:para-nitrobenzyl esterase [Fulvimarina manganoxydans]|uniref:Carboxylic ester hydrolase n=1 Tax=Fulvimarina manganoxydans TaxID=937218 RepID=A0A1W1ZSK9_9HYPH|nr:carboxylesterase family protein [Fulvimarina manganoxydans]SMC51364.1 para-nitrobenzyl esterase [Fulvimarina manganoxydans]